MHTLSHHFHNKHDFGLKSLTDMYPNYVLQSYIVYNKRYIIYRMFHKPAVLAQHDFCDEIFNWVWRKAFFKISKTHNPLKFWSFSAFKKDGFRSRTLLGRLNEWAERVRIGNRFMVFISRENDSFPRYPVRKLAWKWIEIWLAKVLIGLWIEIQFSCFCNQAICLRIFQNESFLNFLLVQDRKYFRFNIFLLSIGFSWLSLGFLDFVGPLFRKRNLVWSLTFLKCSFNFWVYRASFSSSIRTPLSACAMNLW